MHGVMVKRLLHHKGTLKASVVHRYTAEGNTTLRDFATTFYNLRKATNNSAMKGCLKLIMNSLIGRFSMAEKSHYTTASIPLTDNYRKIEEKFYIDQSEAELPEVGRLVRLTSMVTAYSKVYLDMLAEKAGYDNLCYCDTDSLIVT